MSPTLHIDTASDDGSWLRAIARGCLLNTSDHPAHRVTDRSGVEAGEVENIIHNGSNSPCRIR